MIHLVHQPEAGEATARFAFDADDLPRRTVAGATLADHAIRDCASPREPLTLFGATPGAADAPGGWRTLGAQGAQATAHRRRGAGR
ncbi:MAG TPA: hypothetical protein VK195_09950 [Burkholderiaceae bacterium]|nr:hypothetical protein [Burkholderiaceae bacterium]